MNMLEYMLAMSEANKTMTKAEFGRLVHSDDPEEVNAALEALALAGDYDNLED